MILYSSLCFVIMFQNFVNYLSAFSVLCFLVIIAFSFGVLTFNREDDLDDLDFNKLIGR